MSRPADAHFTGNNGCLVALLIGLGTVGGTALLTGASLNIRQEWGVLVFQVLFVAAPFGALATARESGRAAWLTAVALTVIFWGLMVADALVRRGAGGADIGLGLLMLLSPLIVTGGAFAAGAVAKRRR